MPFPKKKIAALAEKIDGLRDELDAIRSYARDAFEEKSDAWKDSDAGQEQESLLDTLEQACDDIENAIAPLLEWNE